jgi:hypothetical protein
MTPGQCEHRLDRRRTDQVNVKFHLRQGGNKRFEGVHDQNANSGRSQRADF